MSSVYLGHHLAIARQVAVKLLRKELASDPVQRDRFIREARAVNRINHDNIVDITDFGETDDGMVYLVMEYVPGRSLFQLLPEGPLSSLRALGIVEQVASALGRAHQMGIVHRDLKPENILLVETEDDRDIVKLLDFGIAKIFDAPSLTGSQQIFGTPGYIAPEYIQSANIDGRADLYSLGVILYELVTGALPYDYEYPGDLLVKHVTEPPIAPRQRHPDLEVTVERFILQCLQKNPRARFRDAYHFIEELRTVRERLGDALSWGSMSQGSTGFSDASGVVARPSSGAESRTLVNTASYERPETGERSDDPYYASVNVEIVISDEIPLPASEVASPEYGVFGVKRWRQRCDALREAVATIQRHATPPEAIAQALGRAERLLRSLEHGLRELEPSEHRAETVHQEVAALRVSLGKKADILAEALSRSRRALEAESNEYERAKVEHREAVAASHGRGRPSAHVDGLLHRIAELDEARQRRTLEAERLQAELAEVLDRLNERSEGAERELERLKRTIEVEMDRLQAVSDALRDPLDSVEDFVKTWWASRR